MTEQPRNRIKEQRIVTRDEISDHAGNIRKHPKAQQAALAGLLEEIGIAKSITAYYSARNNGQLTIIDGHQRMSHGHSWPAEILDVTDDEADQLMVLMDEIGRMAQINREKLAAVLPSMSVGSPALQELIAAMAKAAGLFLDPEEAKKHEAQNPGPTAAAQLAEKWETAPGQVWEIPSATPGIVHRLMCGDSTNAADVAILLGDDKIDQLNCDPPYGVDYSELQAFRSQADGWSRNTTPIEADSPAEIKDYRKFFKSFLELIPFAEYNTVYICGQPPKLVELRLAMADAGINWADDLTWVKNCHTVGRKDYAQKSELITYGWKGKHKFFGGFVPSVFDDDPDLRKLGKPQLIEIIEELRNRDLTDVIREQRTQKAALHPTMKPGRLIARLIAHGTEEAAIVYDPFGGSGTTLLAAERMKRQARIMELTRGYVAVMLEQCSMIGLQPRRIR